MFFRATVLSLLGCLFFLQTLGHVRSAVSDGHCAAAHGPPAAIPPVAGLAPSPAGLPAEPADFVELAPDTRLVDVQAEQLERWMNSDGAAPAARLVPSFRQGIPEGIKVYAIRPGGLFHALGLEPGDVLRAINGVPAVGTESGRLIRALAFEPRRFLDLELRRAGAPLRVVVLVHGAVD
jgi:general secretion pathway protein C